MVLPLDGDLWRLLVKSDTEAFKFVLDLSSVGQGLHDIQDDKDAGARSSHTNYLSTSTLSVLGTFDDTWEIKKLDLGTLVIIDSWDTCQSGELVVGCL